VAAHQRVLTDLGAGTAWGRSRASAPVDGVGGWSSRSWSVAGGILRRTRTAPSTVTPGRHVEFNLVHDRGTTFGLQTDARIESVLMGLLPRAALDYSPVYAPGSFEAELMAMLEPKDWVGGE
jgi:hypothetical protein